MNIFYIIGVIVVVLFVAGFFGLHVWNRLADRIQSAKFKSQARRSIPGRRPVESATGICNRVSTS